MVCGFMVQMARAWAESHFEWRYCKGGLGFRGTISQYIVNVCPWALNPGALAHLLNLLYTLTTLQAH